LGCSTLHCCTVCVERCMVHRCALYAARCTVCAYVARCAPRVAPPCVLCRAALRTGPSPRPRSRCTCSTRAARSAPTWARTRPTAPTLQWRNAKPHSPNPARRKQTSTQTNTHGEKTKPTPARGERTDGARPRHADAPARANMRPGTAPGPAAAARLRKPAAAETPRRVCAYMCACAREASERMGGVVAAEVGAGCSGRGDRCSGDAKRTSAIGPARPSTHARTHVI
jgi:hypothetical protein